MKTKFKVTPVNGISPIIIDYCNYKITILMLKGVTIKFFKEHENRWYKIKETTYDFFEINDCIAWAKNAIDNNYADFQDRLQKQIILKNK
jgi:hypothetical protein